MIKTDMLIVGAGPTGLFTVFEAGLLKMKCHLIDALPVPGGQCAEIYPKKPIFDIPAYPEILAGDLVDQLMEQIKPFTPGFTLGERAETLEKQEDGSFIVTTNMGTKHHAPVVVIAGGLGSFEPRKPPISNIADFERNGVEYIIKEPDMYKGKTVVIAGGGDSALDWTIFLANVAEKVYLVHRRKDFRGALDSVEKVAELAKIGKIDLLTDSQVVELHGNGKLNAVVIKHRKGEKENTVIKTDHFVPLFGLAPKLGPLNNWGLEIESNAIKVNNALDYQTNIPGVFAIGDVNVYPGKLKLILSGFHEAAVMCQFAYKIINPNKKFTLKYTTVGGVEGFDGSIKEAKRAVVKKIT
ncbi:MAG: NAD(P)/FAD-dependent oxidoreductase [Bacteroidota bacterium]